MCSVKGWIIWNWFDRAPVQNVQTHAKYLEHICNFSTFKYILVFDGFIVFGFQLLFCLFVLQGFFADFVRYIAFFSYFTIQLAQLFLCCFADQPPEGKTILEKVGGVEHIENAHAAILWFQMLSSRHFSHSEKILWVHGTPSFFSHNHFIFLTSCERSVNMCLLLHTMSLSSDLKPPMMPQAWHYCDLTSHQTQQSWLMTATSNQWNTPMMQLVAQGDRC